MNEKRLERLAACTAMAATLLFASTGCPGGGDGGGDTGTTDGGGNGDVVEDGGETGDASDGGTTGDAADGEGGSDADGGGTGDVADGGGDDADGGETVTKEGLVTLTQSLTVANTTWNVSGTASFTRTTTSGDTSDTCSTTSMNGCTLQDCSLDGDGGSSESTQVSAGDEVTASSDGGSVTMSPTGDPGTYSGNATATRLWDGSQTVTIEAPGDADGVPSFTGELTPASEVTLTTPDAGSSVTVDTGSAWPVEWETSNVTTGSVLVSLTASNQSRSTTIRCDWDATAGSNEVPADLLADMTKTEGTYQIYGGATTDVTAGDYEIDLSARELARDSDDDAASGTATFE